MVWGREARWEGNAISQCHVVQNSTSPNNFTNFRRVIEQSAPRSIQTPPPTFEEADGSLHTGARTRVGHIKAHLLCALRVGERGEEPAP